MNTQKKILLLLLCAVVAMVVYAINPIDWSFASQPLKKIKIAMLQEINDTTALKEKADTVPVKVKDTNPQTILFIGDSMLEGLARRFYEYAGRNGHDLHTVLWYSSTSERWAKTRTLDYYLQQVKPTYVVICLCSNELFVRDLDQREEYIKTIISKIGNVPFVWISPPNWKDDTGINEIIIRHVGKERYFDSRHLELERGKDHMHPTISAAAVWFDKVALWLSSDETAHPIVMEVPTEKVKSTNWTIMMPNDPGK